jgi:Ser/Thr protein kinase RdoA (MazF antagonist)
MSAVERARAHYSALRDADIEPIDSLINQTFRVGQFILQRLHPVFDPAMHGNIAALTAHLSRKGMLTPELVPADDGALWIDLEGDGIWRLQTFVEGASFDAVQSVEQAHAAGELVGRFHAAVDDLEHQFVGLRAGVHDTAAHLEKLARALDAHADHRLAGNVRPLAKRLIAELDSLGGLPALAPRIGHGDLKISNLLFAGSTPPARDQARCLIDLDTLAPMHLAHELGDAWRSWCNPNREDVGEVCFDLPIFEASWQGYARGYGRELGEAERRALLVGVEHICLELTARFLADALLESYFGWDAERFETRGDHNLVRANGQWALFEAARDCRDARAAILAR